MSNLTVVGKMAERFEMSPAEFEKTVKATVCPANITNEQFNAFLMVAKEYNLNPITKQIYAFPSKGGIVPIVSIDGWLRVINEHPQFDGMEFIDSVANEKLFSITCRMYRKDRSRPVEVTEYMGECVRGTDTWKQWPARMLRHKATIQAARYAFGLAGIYDEDEAQRIAGTEKNITPNAVDSSTGEIKRDIPALQAYTDEQFESSFPGWQKAVDNGKTPEQVLAKVRSARELTDDQAARILSIQPAVDGEFVDAMNSAEAK